MRREIALRLTTASLAVAIAVAACGATPTPTAIPPATRTPRPTFTTAPSRTPTARSTATATVTNTPAATATFTPKPTDTARPTNTPRPPTNTPVPAPPPPPPPPTDTPIPPKPYTALLFGVEPNCGVSVVEGTVYDTAGQPKRGAVVWMSDASGNYRDGFTFAADNSGATGAGKTPGWYSIVIQQPGMKKGNWFVVIVDSKGAVKAGNQQELSERYFFETDNDANTCKPGGAGRQKWMVDFKQNY